MTASKALEPQIRAIESKNTILKQLVDGKIIPGTPTGAGYGQFQKVNKVLSPDYQEAFYAYLASRGMKQEAALYEGSDSAGGFAVPITVADQIVPLAPLEMGVRALAMVIPTSMDIKVPQKAGFGQAALKTENNPFTEVDPTLSQFTLSAFMVGSVHTISWELAQDVPSFQAFTTDDILMAQSMLEEQYYVTGNGTGQAQGLIGNVGAGVTEEPDGNGNLVSIAGTLDLIGTLNALYHPGASWLMTRATSIIIRKAQVQSNLFEPVWTREGGKDYLHGFPVAYSAYMPTAARGNCPVLFGDFKRGYIIGDRGGSGINVKVLDQPLATQGQLQLLGYRRSDGRVRRSEAIQAYNVAAS
jgi:HK97 family phage major capsid protein